MSKFMFCHKLHFFFSGQLKQPKITALPQRALQSVPSSPLLNPGGIPLPGRLDRSVRFNFKGTPQRAEYTGFSKQSLLETVEPGQDIEP